MLEKALHKHGEIRALVNLGKMSEMSDDAAAAANNGSLGSGGGGNSNRDNNNNNNNECNGGGGSDEIDEDDLEAVAERCRVRRTCKGNREALKMYHEAADNGRCGDGMFNVAACYEAEIGTERDEAMAIKYYTMALTHGVALAEHRLVMYNKE